VALNTRTSIVGRNAELDAIAPLANGGKLRLYTGAQPATPETAIGAQVLLAEWTMPTPAFGAAAAGVITANAITAVNALATGQATWFRLVKSDGVTPLWDGSAGIGATFNANLNSDLISVGALVNVGSLTKTLPMQGA
jgi:hypothetical protein